MDDDDHEEDPRVVEVHSRIDDSTNYLWSIPGFEEYCTTLEDETLEDVDSNDLEEEINSEIDDVHVQTSLMITFRPVLMIKLRTGSTHARGFQVVYGQDTYNDGCSESGEEVDGDGYSDDDNDEDTHHCGYEEDTYF